MRLNIFSEARTLHFIILSAVFLLVHFLLFWHYGIRMFVDSSDYLNRADYFLEHLRFKESDQWFYSVPVLFMALFRWMAPDTIVPIILFQCFFSWVATIALYKATDKVFNSKTAGIISGLLFILWVDNVHWNLTLMTDSFLRSMSCILLYALVNWRNEIRNNVSLLILSILLFLTRPTAIVMVVSECVFLATIYWKKISTRLTLASTIAFLLFAVLIQGANKIMNNWNFAEQYSSGNIVTYSDQIKNSNLFHSSLNIGPPPDSSFLSIQSPVGKALIFVVDNPGYVLKGAALKIFYLLSYSRPYYSAVHNIYSILWVLMIYVSFAVGWKRVQNRSIKIYILSIIVLNCGLIGLLSVDWDNRFYIPMESGIILLASGGAAWLYERLMIRRHQERNT